MELFGIGLSTTAVIIFSLIILMFVLPPLFVIGAILYYFLKTAIIIPMLFGFWKGLVILVFLSTDIVFFILSDGKSLIPWGNFISQLLYTVFVIFYMYMNILKFQ